MAGLAPLDWAVLVLYVAGLVGLGYVLGRDQASGEDYHLAGRNVSAAPVALSVMATQAGAVSLIGAPAFVALHPEGGLKWLQYELVLPVAMMILMVTLVPYLRRERFVTVYEYLERRFDRPTRRSVSIAFQASRGLATGVAIYALAIVLATALAWPLAPTILLIGGVTLVYGTLGGMRMVITSDALQMGIIVLGLGASTLYLLGAAGGWSALVAAVEPARTATLDFTHHGLGDGHDFAFWPMLLGGFFLYVSYYGLDQSEAQRFLSAASEGTARRAVLLNGLLRFPLVLAYCLFGLLLAGYVATNAEFAARIAEGPMDELVPRFIVTVLPPGLRGLLVAAILAAAMSSLDSALNSLSAATLRDVVEPALRAPLDPEAHLRWGRGLSFAWGAACTVFAFLAGTLSGGVIAVINMIGSLFYGPILAVFLLGFLSRRATARGARLGLAVGISGNLLLWWGAPDVSWLWWNPIGFAIAFVAGAMESRFASGLSTRSRPGLVWRDESGRVVLPGRFGAGYLGLSGFFALILAGTAFLGHTL